MLKFDTETLKQLASAPVVRDFFSQYSLVKQPGMNLFDSARVQAGRQGQWDAVAAGADADRDTYKQMLRGVATMAGANRGPQFEASIDAASRNIAKLAPYAMTIAPGLWDQLHGTRGSAASLASSFQRAHPDRPALQNAATAQEVFRKLYRPTTAGAVQPPLSARDVGRLYQSMHHEGLMSHKGGLGSTGVADRLSFAGGAVRAIQDANMAAAHKVAFELPALFKRVTEPVRRLFRPADKPDPFTPVDQAVSGGTWKGFKAYDAAARRRLFQTDTPTAHPGYARTPPERPELFRRLTDPATAAATRQGLSKEAISADLVRRTFMAQPASKLTPERALRFERKLNNWLAGPNRSIAGTQIRNNAAGRAHNELGKLHTGSAGEVDINAYRLIPHDALRQYQQQQLPALALKDMSASFELRPEVVDRLHRLYGGPRPALVGQGPVGTAYTNFAGSTPAVVSTPQVNTLGHELGHVATNPRMTRLADRYGKKELWFPPDTNRSTLASERLANRAFRRVATTAGPQLGEALGVPAPDPSAVNAFSRQQLEGYKLQELAAAQTRRHAAGGRHLTAPELKLLSKPTRDFVTKLQETTRPGLFDKARAWVGGLGG